MAASRSRSRSRARRRARWAGAGARPGRARDDRDRRRRGADRRREPGDRAARASTGCDPRRCPVSRRSSSSPERACGVDLETVAFAIAPRLNAAGRMGEAMEAARAAARRRSRRGGRAGRPRSRRRTWAAGSHEDGDGRGPAPRRGSRRPGGDGRSTGDWPVGMIGLVAGRLAEERGRPAVVGTEVDGVIRASCRSGGGFDLGAALAACSELFIRHGGHAGAAGFELAPDRWEAFRERFLALVTDDLPPSSDGRPELRVDLVVPAPGGRLRVPGRAAGGSTRPGPGTPIRSSPSRASP